MSKLSAIKAKLAAILAQLSVVKTDKAVLEYDGEDLKAGMAVYVTNEETGERVAAADGEYTTEDGKVIVVKDGMVESVTDPVAEIDGADEEPKPEDAPVEEPVEEEKLEEEPVEEPKETEPTEIEKIREEINELYKLVDSILEKIGESRREADERLAKLEKMSAARPAEEEVELSRITPKTGDAKIDKRLERAKELGRNWRD